jgi:hypothetical protein
MNAVRVNPRSCVEDASGFKAEDALEIELADELVHGHLAMLAAYFGEDQFGAVGVVEAAKAGVPPFSSWRARRR